QRRCNSIPVGFRPSCSLRPSNMLSSGLLAVLKTPRSPTSSLAVPASNTPCCFRPLREVLTMKANALLKWLVPAALLAVVLIILKSWVAGGSTPSPEQPVDQGNIQLSAEQA